MTERQRLEALKQYFWQKKSEAMGELAAIDLTKVGPQARYQSYQDAESQVQQAIDALPATA